jgi:sugar transferase (PEP-CTERM system associated)
MFNWRIRHIPLLTVLQLLADGLLCIFALALAAEGALASPGALEALHTELPNMLVLPSVGFAMAMILMYSCVGIYRRGAVSVSFFAMLGRSLGVVLVGASIAWLVLQRAGGASFAWRAVPWFLAYMAAGVVFVRSGVHVAQRASVGAKRVLVLGTGREACDVARDIRSSRRMQRLVVGFFPSGSEQGQVPASERLFTGASLEAVVQEHRIDEVIVAVREQRGGAVPMEALLSCRIRGIPVHDLAGFYEQVRGEVPVDSLKASWLVYGEGFVQSHLRRVTKRSFDVACSAFLLVLTSPLMLLAALAIRLDSPGPILYRQERVGFRGQRFMCVKFRSMTVDAEKDGVARWATKGDARVTRVGALMRKTRIDELPQLLSVLEGKMSLVGPRPERPQFVEELKQRIPFYDLRHSVKPGLTGWAQVRFTYGATLEEARRKHQFDLYYVKNNSLWLDLLILLETVSVVLFREGAQ